MTNIIDHLNIALVQLEAGAADMAYVNIEQAISALRALELKSAEVGIRLG